MVVGLQLTGGGGLCAACGRLTYSVEHIDYCAGCKKSTNDCSCFDPVFGRPTIATPLKVGSRGPTPGFPSPPATSGFEALRISARNGALSYLSQLIGASPISQRLIGV